MGVKTLLKWWSISVDACWYWRALISHLVTPSYCTWDSPVDTVQLNIWWCLLLWAFVMYSCLLKCNMDTCFVIINACFIYFFQLQVWLLLHLWQHPGNSFYTCFFWGNVNMCVCVTTQLPSVTVIIITQCMFKRYDNH